MPYLQPSIAYLADEIAPSRPDLPSMIQQFISSLRPDRFLELTARIAFWATIILIPFRYRFDLLQRPVGEIYRDYTDLLIFASDITLVATLVFWLIHKLTAREKVQMGPLFIIVPIVGLAVISGISIAGSLDPQLSLYHTARLVLLAGFSFYVIDQQQSPVSIAIPVLIQVGIQAVVGIAQSLQQSDIGFQRLGEYLLNPEWAGISVVFSGDQRWLRVYGLSDHPNILGGCLAFGLIVLLGAYILKPRLGGTIIAVGFTVGLATLFLTFSRSAWLALGAGIIFLLANFISGRQHIDLFRHTLQFLAGGAILLLPFLIGYSELVATRIPNPLGGSRDLEIIEQRSFAERAVLNEAGIEVFVDNPILGSGIGTLPQAIRQNNPNVDFDYQPSHMMLIDAAAETGLLGVTVYAILLATPWIVFILRRDLQQSPVMLVASALLLAVTIVGFFDYYPWLLMPGRLWQYLIWGLWAVAYRTVHHASSPES